MIKCGGYVQIISNSDIRQIIGGKIRKRSAYPGGIGMTPSPAFEVIETKLSIPCEGTLKGDPKIINNTIIRNPINHKYYCVKEKYLKNVPDDRVNDFIDRYNIKIGDYVKVLDNSYNLKMTSNGYKKYRAPGGINGEESPVFRVEAVGLTLPAADEDEINDAIIKNIYTDEQFFIKSEYLMNVATNQPKQIIKENTINFLKDIIEQLEKDNYDVPSIEQIRPEIYTVTSSYSFNDILKKEEL